MTYKEFHDIFKNRLTEKQISNLQKFAFQNYEDAHGYRPVRKEQKQFAYDFTIDFLRSMGVAECVGHPNPLAIPLITAINLWNSLEYL